MSKRRSRLNDALLKFLKERVESNQGISLEELTGHLVFLPPELRTYACSIKSLKKFLQKFPKVFVIRQQGKVYVRTRSRRATSTLNGNVRSSWSSTPHHDTDEDDVTCLNDVRGTVYRIFNVYGFISVEYPINTSVYFDVKTFENAQHKSLRSSGLQVGNSVILDAKLGPKDCEARFRASRVTRDPMNMPSSSPCPSPHRDNGGGRRNTVTLFVYQHGVIETVKTKHGFVKFGPNQRERAFFSADTVARSLGTSVRNLQDMFTVGDKVRINAKRIKKPSGKSKWKVTAVSLCCSDDLSCVSSSEGPQSGNEVFISDEEYDLQDLLQAKLDEYESRDDDRTESPAGYANSDASSFRADSRSSLVKGNSSEKHTLSDWERRRDLAGERGFLYPVTESVGTVKFGPRRGLTARAAVQVTYREEEIIHNLLWEVADGQEVLFDAVRSEDNKWIATLVWIGRRPAQPLAGDSEDIFKKVTKRTRGSREPLKNAEPGQSGNFGVEETPGNVSPASTPVQPSITIYRDAKGAIVQTRECAGTCQVQERGAPRKIEFTSECFYKDGTVFVGDLNKVLREGDTVFLDYMVGGSGTKEETRCDVVWQGMRPRGVRHTSSEEFWLQLQIDTQHAENSLCFEGFDTEIERQNKASRDTSRVPSNPELPEDMVRSMGSEASSSVSVSRLLDTPPAKASTPAYLRSLGTCNEVTVRESSPELSFRSANVGDEVLRRLARMAAVEIFALEKSLRVVLRSVGVQTDDGGSSSSPDDKILVPAFKNASTQTLSTGEIKWTELFIS